MINLKTAFSKSRMTPPFWMCLPIAAAFCLWACDNGHEHEEEATVKIETPANGSTVTGPSVMVRVSTTHFTYGAPGAGKVSASQHEVAGGHIHIWLDNSTREDASTVFDLHKNDTTTINITTPGKHYIVVAGATADHSDVEGMEDSVSFTVTIP